MNKHLCWQFYSVNEIAIFDIYFGLKQNIKFNLLLTTGTGVLMVS